MSNPTIDEILQKAAEAVKALPEHLQGVAFSEAVRMLEGGDRIRTESTRKRPARRSSGGRVKKSSPDGGEKRKGRSRSPDVTIDRNLNLRPRGGQSLIDFYNEKKPNRQNEHNLVFVYYLERVLGLSGVTVNQVYTCYKDVKAKVPSNLRNSLQVTAARTGWVDTEDSQDLKVTTRGENVVEHDLPRKAAE